MPGLKIPTAPTRRYSRVIEYVHFHLGREAALDPDYNPNPGPIIALPKVHASQLKQIFKMLENQSFAFPLHTASTLNKDTENSRG